MSSVCIYQALALSRHFCQFSCCFDGENSQGLSLSSQAPLFKMLRSWHLMLAMKRHCANATRDGQTNIYFILVSTMGISQGEFSGMVFSFHLYMGLGTELRSPGGEELLC